MPRQTRHGTEYSGVYFVELANQVQSFFVRYKRNGKSIEEKAGHSNQGWNAEKADQLRTERMSGIFKADCEMQPKVQYKDQQNWTFSKIFAEYLRIRRELKGRENDVYRFKNYLEMEFADKTPEDVTHGDLERFRHNLQNKRLKPATVRHALELLRRLANFAVKRKLCPGLRFKIKMPIVENHKTESLTQDQLQKLLDVLDEEQDVQVSNLVRLALFTGMKRGELFSLSWCDIDFYKKTITVRSGKNGQHPKIPMNELAENVLTEQAQAEAGSKFVFPGRWGKKRTDCKRPLLRIKLKAGLPDDFRILQGLRHVYASMLASSGNVELEKLQALLTQKSPLMTQRYVHLLNEADNNSFSMAAEDANLVLDSAEKEEILSCTVNDDSPENISEFPEKDTLEEAQKEEFFDDYQDTEILPEELLFEVEQEEDFVEQCTGTEIAPEVEETTFAEDDLSIHIDQVVEKEVCMQNENELTDSAVNTQKNKDLDLYVDLEPMQKEIFCSDNVFAEFFEKNKNFTYSVKNESIEPDESTEEAAKAIDVEEGVVAFEKVEPEKAIEALKLSENESTEPNVDGCVESNTLEDVSFWKTELLEEGIVSSENLTAGTVEKTLEIEEIAENEIVLIAEKENIVKVNSSAEQHYEVCGEDSPTENMVTKHEEDTEKQEFISKFNKSEPETEKKEALLNHIYKQDFTGVTPREINHNEVLIAKNSAAENKVQQKSKPSIDELKNDLRALSQLIHSAPRQTTTTLKKKQRSSQRR